jgi:APA family basic amino acid/polyamine antiporter
VWTCLLCLSGTYTELLNYVIFAALLFFMLTTVGLIALRVRQPHAERPVKAVGYPWIPGIYVLLTGLLCVNLLLQPAQQRYAGLGLIVIAVGVPVYYGWRRWAAGSA